MPSPQSPSNEINTFGILEDSYENSFSFLSGGMEHYVETEAHQDDPATMPRTLPVDTGCPEALLRGDDTAMADEDTAQASRSDDTVQGLDNHHQDAQASETPSQPIVVPQAHPNHAFGYPYASSYQHTSTMENYSGHYHPYRSLSQSNALPSPASAYRSLPHPLSPPRSHYQSDPESAVSHYSFIHTPSSVVAPSLISPFSAMSSLGEISPHNAWYHPLPMDGQNTTSPLNDVAQLPYTQPTDLAMVQGYPYSAHPPPPAPRRSGRAPAPRNRASARRKVKREPSAETESELGQRTNGLGLTPESEAGGDERKNAKTWRSEEIRRARVANEQKRRDENAAGFEALRAALPPTTQRASKIVLLDRAVTAIQQQRSANAFLLEKNNALELENAKLREQLMDVTRSLTEQCRAHTGSINSSPQSREQ